MKRLYHVILASVLCAWLTAVAAHFSLAPKITVEPLPLPQSDATLFHSGTPSVSRGDFSDYLARLIAFDTKYQRLQPSFSAHFNLLRGTAFFHPENVHKYIDNLQALRNNPLAYQAAVQRWIRGQIDIYARLVELRQQAKRQGLEQSPDVAATLDFYAAGAKTALLEELIVAGDMEPSVAGMRAFVNGKEPTARRLIERGPESDTDLTPPDEQRRLKDRWRRFRQEVLQSGQATNRCDSVKSLSAPSKTLMVEIGTHRIDFEQYRAIFGVPADERFWGGQKRANCSRLILFYAMADLVDELGILPARLEKDIRVSGEIYLMARQLTTEAAVDLMENKDGRQTELTIARELMQYPKVLEVKDWLLARKQDAEEKGADRVIDQALIEGTEWHLRRTLAPKHSIHM